MSESTLIVNIVIDNKIENVTYTSTTTAEDVCILLCKQLGITPVARHLFALRDSKLNFLTSASLFNTKHTCFDLRIRYKVANIGKLKDIDHKAFDYYFHQARTDVLENKIPDLVYEKYKNELLGLGVTDMYRVMLEKDIPRESVESDYKKYIPKAALKRHPLFIKKPIHDSLGKLKKSGHNSFNFVKMEYLKQLEMMAPEYLTEEFKAITDFEGSSCIAYVKVSPYHDKQPGIRICKESNRENWQQLCTIDELCYISVRQDGTVEISRKNGIPFYLKFPSLSAMYSFVSLLDGYYRLMCKWIFNICKDMLTPSLQRLYAMRCHGPVGGEFSYAKLEEKRGNRPGCFILRESELKYNIFYIDVCMKETLKPKTFKLELLSGTEFIFNNDLTRYKNINQLIATYNDPNGEIFLQECLPPSEYDTSPLLLCQSNFVTGDSLADSSSIHGITSSNPVCISSKNIQVYKGQKKESSSGTTITYRSMWRLTKGKKVEVAMKVIKHESQDKYLRNFMELAGNWSCLQSTAIIKLYGITLVNPVSMVMEYVRLGPLNEFLKENKTILKTVDLVEATSTLASALWHLEEHGIVHGNIRCKKILVCSHQENEFKVKLADPGIHTTYASKEVHWIPVECYSNLDFAKKSTAADVWAFATTAWEIFKFGEAIPQIDHIDAMRLYASGKRLPKPEKCPPDVYQLMKECWEADPHRRKQPQALMRDINQILYQVYNSRRVHSYSQVNFSRSRLTIASSNSSISSNTTASTAVVGGPPDELISICDISQSDCDLSDMSNFSKSANSMEQNWLLNSLDMGNNEDGLSYNTSNVFSAFNFSMTTSVTSLDSISSMQSIFELDADCNVILQGRIGQGFYGDVYKGTLEYFGDKDGEARKVAVKKLKTSAASTGIQDFEREISIMKTLKHPNIVEILGVLQDPEVSLVMEFVQYGSLQSYLKIHHETLSIKQLVKYASDIAQGMDYLGTKHIVHRDLAARNILVVDDTHVKISDFGLAQVMGTNEYYILKTNRELPIKWYAPESLRDGKFSSASDVWSYGVTLCEMFSHGEEPKLPVMVTGKMEGQEQQILLNAIETGARFPCPPICPQSIYVRLIYPCWKANPHERPKFFDLCKETENLFQEY